MMWRDGDRDVDRERERERAREREIPPFSVVHRTTYTSMLRYVEKIEN